jgi:hypothetical protein
MTRETKKECNICNAPSRPDANASMEGEQDHTRDVIRKIEEMPACKSRNKKNKK